MGTDTPNLGLYVPASGEGHPPDGGPDHDWSPDMAANLDLIDTLLAFGVNGVFTKVITGLSATPATAAAALDANFTTPRSGLMALDATNNRWWVRVGTTWRFTQLASAPATIPTGAKVTLTDGATVSVDASAGTYFVLGINAARVMDVPSNPATAQEVTFDIKNTGGSGALTWNAVYKLAGPWTDAGSGKRRLIRFVYDGTNWVEIARTGGDV